MRCSSGFTFPEHRIKQLDCGQLLGVDRLSGGNNNVLWSLSFDTGIRRVLKDYLIYTPDSAERQNREWAYLSQLHAQSIENVPAPVLRCDDLGCSVFTQLDGIKITSLDITDDFIKLAANHIAEVALVKNSSKLLAKGAYFSIEDHISDVETRLSALEGLVFEDCAFPDLADFFNNSLRPLWIGRRRDIKSVQPEGYFEHVKQYLSPSDFGFHNILVNGAQLGFLDFEYAGQDDLAKLVADFSLTPQTPISPKQAILFQNLIVSKINLDTQFIGRTELLKFIGEIKWVCIILNDFLPFFAKRRRQACSYEEAKRLQEKLEAAQKFFEKCKNTELSISVKNKL